MNDFDYENYQDFLRRVENMTAVELACLAKLTMELEDTQESVPLYRVAIDFIRSLAARVSLDEGTPREIVARMKSANYAKYIAQMCTPSDTHVLMETFTAYGLYYSPIVTRPAKEAEDFIFRVREAVQMTLKTLATELMDLAIRELIPGQQGDAQPVSSKSPVMSFAEGTQVYITKSEAYSKLVGLSGKLMQVDATDENVPYRVELDTPERECRPLWVLEVQPVEMGDRVLIDFCSVEGWTGRTGTITDLWVDGYSVRCDASGEIQFVESVARFAD